MKQSIISLVSCLLLFSVAIEANLFPLVNISSTCSSKQPCVLRWDDDGNEPKLTELKVVDIQLMTGPSENQIQVVDLGSVPASTGKIVYKIPPNLGPAGEYYFYKFTSGSDEIWSSRFTIQDISGTIPGFDPTTIDSNGNIIGSNSTNSTDSTDSTNSTDPTTISQTNLGSNSTGTTYPINSTDSTNSANSTNSISSTNSTSTKNNASSASSANIVMTTIAMVAVSYLFNL